MGFQNSRRLEIDVVRSVTTPGATLAVLGDPLDFPAPLILFVNATDGLLFISDNATDDKIPLVAGANFILDVRSNSGLEPISLSKGKQFYVRREGAAAGTIYMTPFYMKE
jgi:hypothetical protein